MLSVGSRDGRKGLEQRFSSSNNNNNDINNNNIRDMDETELEEGEACSYQEEDDTSIDPDVALSYLDEKLQSVLGHFKKDFEGVVSAENLGAKYGIYGSFLPAYRRSPVWSHSRSPPRVQNHNTPQSPSTIRLEGGQHNTSVHANIPHPVKHGSATSVSASSNAYKHPSKNDISKQTKTTQPIQSVEACTPKSEVRDQRTLKVRIKVGSDNPSVKKNAAIYSGLGLDGSPTSSFGDSPMEGEELSRGLPSDHESLVQFLKMMTSSPLHGGYLLSPLPDHLIQLSERPKLLQDIFTQPSSKTTLVNSVVECPCNSMVDDKTLSVEDSMRLLDTKASSLQVKREDGDSPIGFDSVSCEELVSSALKLPLLSNAYSTMGDSTKASLKQNVYSDAAAREPLEPIAIPVSLSEPNKKANSAGNVVGSGAADAPDLVTDSGKFGDSKGETTNSSTNTETAGYKIKKTSKSGRKDPVKQKADRSTTSEGGMGLPCRKEQLSSGDKKNVTKKQVHGLAAKKVAAEDANDHELEHSSTQKDLSKAMDKYKDFFGDMNEHEADVMDSPDLPPGDRLNMSEVVAKATLANENTSRDKTSSLGTRKRAVARTGIGKGSTHDASLPENGRPISDPAPGGVDTDDKWVCCDKCQQWRLLPPGSNTESLQGRQWLCSMQTWLPDMNRCSIGYEEAIAAFRARYPLLAENPNGLRVPLDNLAAGTSSADILDNIVPNGGKMIDKVRKSSKSSFQDSPNRIPSSIRKKQLSAKDRTLIEAKESPLKIDLDFQQSTKSSEAYVETKLLNKTVKHRTDRDSDGGHAKMTKIKGKRERDQQVTRNSKKSKTLSMQRGDSVQITPHDEDNDMLGVNSGYILGTYTVGKDKMANSDLLTTRNLKHDVDGDVLDTFGKSKFQVETFPDVSKSGTRNIAPKKRKEDSFQDPSISTPASSKLVSDNEQRSRKKHRMSKSEGKESSASKRNSKADKRGRSVTQPSLDNNEPSRKDSLYAQPVVAATSSSSKVSGSLKAKSKLQELKGSPVESVSSSPLRISNVDKLASGSKIIVEKDNVHNKLTTASLGKCSDGDQEGGNDPYGSISKDVTETGTLHGSVEPSMIDLQQQDKSNGGLHHKNGLAQFSPAKLDYGLPTNGFAGSLDPENGPSDARNSDNFVNEPDGGEDHLDTNVSRSGKSEKDSSVFCKDKNQTFVSNSDKGKVKMSESYANRQGHTPVYEEKVRDSKVKVPEKLGSTADKAAKDVLCNNQEPSISKSKARQEFDETKSSKKLDVEKVDRLMSISTRDKSRHLPSSDGDKSERANCLPSHKGNGMSTSSSDAHASDVPKDPKPNKKADSQNGTHHIPAKHSMSNGHRVKNQDAPSPLRRDASSQAANSALKEATNLKHLADRLKSSGSTEYTGIYFEAIVKYLHAASLLESGKTENAKHIDIYSTTGNLCGFCAHECEKSKDMVTAALAYKCMELAYMRVIYSTHLFASRDHETLQTVLQMVPPGESPSSSASDIDNLNNSATGDKAPQARSGDSPQVASNVVIPVRNRPNFTRLLSFARDVNLAMEASKKSRIAFEAANMNMDKEKYKDGMASVKRALDFNFHDVEGLLRLVRLAKDATS